MESDDAGGFLKLSRTQEWLLGDDSAPMNKKARAKVCRKEEIDNIYLTPKRNYLSF